MRDSIVVLKFGSSVLADESAFPAVILEIYREVRRGRKVVAVVSALGETTDQLLKGARETYGELEPECLARLLETGEAQSAAHLGLALDVAGVPARILDPGQIRLQTSDEILDAEPLAFDPDVVRQVLAEVPVVVVPGFSGRREDGSPALLGRGGSDLTALFLAAGLKALECRLLKDVDGLLRVESDGKLDHGTRYATAHYDECLRVGGPLIQPKAVEYAAVHGLSFRIARCGSSGGTLAGPVSSRFEPVGEPQPVRVAVAGLGTVGLGVFRWLQTLSQDVEVTGVLVRDGAKERPAEVPAGLLTTSVDQLLASDPQLIIEVIGGDGTAGQLITLARARGIPVVTANKSYLASRLDLLEDQKALAGSASVGGSVPALETVEDLAATGDVTSFSGILNGTCNFILDRVNRGSSLSDALAEAQLKGLAEADPSLDINGMDCVHKLALLATRAFRLPVTPEQISCQGLDQASPERVSEARAKGAELKLVSRASLENGRIITKVGLEDVFPGDPLADCRLVTNRLVVDTGAGQQITTEGKGAGRWPTTVSVLSDVLELVRSCEWRQARRKSA